jgi:hypothetical protein
MGLSDTARVWFVGLGRRCDQNNERTKDDITPKMTW